MRRLRASRTARCMMKQKTVLAPYGTYVNIYEVIDYDRVLWFDEAAIAALKCAQTHDEHGAPESRKESEFKG